MLLSCKTLYADHTDNGGSSPLMYAEVEEKLDYMERLLARDDVFVNAPDRSSKIVLDYAKQDGNKRVIHLLLEHGARCRQEQMNSS
ncbi:hypothetical protein BDW74DRAFT_19200 [Aspergillus multicolor]|uniref:uncharacterized protein n=1 Tax=Aspergillus multicolor TaxID=41759 RepID=UPI003CCE35CC